VSNSKTFSSKSSKSSGVTKTNKNNFGTDIIDSISIRQRGQFCTCNSLCEEFYWQQCELRYNLTHLLHLMQWSFCQDNSECQRTSYRLSTG
jgi:hypothetical protein